MKWASGQTDCAIVISRQQDVKVELVRRFDWNPVVCKRVRPQRGTDIRPRTFMELPRRRSRADRVVTSLNDSARDMADLVDLGPLEELAVAHPASVDWDER